MQSCSIMNRVLGRKVTNSSRLNSRSFTSSQIMKMPVTELVFPLYNLNSQSLELEQKAHQIFHSFHGVEGLKAAFRGVVLEDNGVAIDTKFTRGVLVLDWTDSSSFHSFYPASPNYASFGKAFKPFVAAPVTPELYEAGGPSVSCASSNFTQIIKVKSSKATEEAWQRLEASLGELPVEKPSLYHANGIEKDEGVFLGLIGWRSWQEYERIAKDVSFLERVKQLNNGETAQNLITQLTNINTV